MIEFKTGDLLADRAEALVNPINCVAVMGAGLALLFKRSFPDNFQAYERACNRREVQPGRMFVHEYTEPHHQPRYIVNFPTKRHWRDKSRMEDIDSGLEALVRVMHDLRIASIAIPPLGSGLGGLKWTEVKPRIEQAMAGVPGARVIIYEPLPAPPRRELP